MLRPVRLFYGLLFGCAAVDAEFCIALGAAVRTGPCAVVHRLLVLRIETLLRLLLILLIKTLLRLLILLIKALLRLLVLLL